MIYLCYCLIDVLFVLSQYKWYNPNVGKTGEDVPDLKKAWEYYEHHTLARYEVNESDKHRFKRADPGDTTKPTNLYPVITLPMKELNDWGIGVGLYFTELRAMMIFLFCAGFISLFNVIYFGGHEYRYYNDNGSEYTNTKGALKKAAMFLLNGSAACMEFEWVACEDGWCNTAMMQGKYEAITTTVMVNGQPTTLVQKNACNGDLFKLGMINYGAVMFLIIASLLFFYYIGLRSTMLDEDNLTASDYSVVVKKCVYFYARYDSIEFISQSCLRLCLCCILYSLVLRKTPTILINGMTSLPKIIRLLQHALFVSIMLH